MVMGRVGEDQEQHLHPFFHQSLAAQFHADPVRVGAAHQHPAGTADTFQAADPFDPRITGIPQCLDHRQGGGGLDGLAVDDDVNELLCLCAYSYYQNRWPEVPAISPIA